MPTSKPKPTGKPSAAQTHTFRVALQDAPDIVREFEIVSSRTLVDLAKAIVRAFDFEFDHAFGFYSNLSGPHLRRSGTSYELFADMGEETDARSVKRTRVAEAFPETGQKMLFLFDYGDDWRFVLQVIRIGNKEAGMRYPRVLKKVGMSPQQYGGWDDEDDDVE
jgi:Plasmid pRiA4b ORF-3-like protein